MFFTNCVTPQEVKNEYRKLAKANHPDLGGDTATMQKINAEYLIALERLNGYTYQDKGETYTYKYERQREQSIMDKVNEILKVAKPTWTIEIIGLWVWVSNTERADKDLLNKNGCGLMWHSKRLCWYWKPYVGKTRFSGRDMDDLREFYGSETFAPPTARAVAAA